jgi:hypothetical protein
MTDTVPAPPIREDVKFIGSDESLGSLFSALAQAQLEFRPIEKDSTASVQMKAGGSYKFDFAGLDVVIAATRPALNRHGLTLMQFPNGEELLSVLAFGGPGGARVESRCFLTQWDGPQGFGSTVTYFRRYCWLSIVGAFPTDEDEDSNFASGNKAEVIKRDRPPIVKAAPVPAAGAASDTTVARVIGLSKRAGFKSRDELEAFSRKEGCGDLKEQSEANALRLEAALQALQAQP